MPQRSRRGLLLQETIKVIKFEPVVFIRETITGECDRSCLAKSSNKHNRIFVTAKPIQDALADEIEDGKVTPRDDLKKRAGYLMDDFQWHQTDAEKMWCFGRETTGANLMADQTKAI